MIFYAFEWSVTDIVLLGGFIWGCLVAVAKGVQYLIKRNDDKVKTDVEQKTASEIHKSEAEAKLYENLNRLVDRLGNEVDEGTIDTQKQRKEIRALSRILSHLENDARAARLDLSEIEYHLKLLRKQIDILKIESNEINFYLDELQRLVKHTKETLANSEILMSSSEVS